MKKLVLNITLILVIINCGLFAAVSSATLNRDASNYVAEIPVDGYSDAERNKAFTTAFKQIITDVSGDAKNIDKPQIQKRLKNISSWVQSYNYTKQPNAAGQQKLFLQIRFDHRSIPNDLPQSAVSTQQKLQPNQNSDQDIDQDNNENDSQNIQEPDANFLDGAILSPKIKNIFPPAINSNTNNLNNQNNIKPTDNLSTTIPTNTSVTPKNVNIPPVLIWLVVISEDLQNNIIADDSSNDSTVRSLKTAATNSGIKIILPTMDLEDLMKVTPDDVCNLDSEIIKTAATRYGTKTIAAGCIFGEKNNRRSTWLLLTDTKKSQWNLSAQDSNSLITKAFDKITLLLTPQNPQSEHKVDPPLSMVSTLPPSRVVPNTTSAAATSPPIPAPTTTLSSQPTPHISPQATLSPKTTAIEDGTPTTITPTDKPELTATNTIPPTPPIFPEATDVNQVTIYVTNVADLDQYAAVVKYLHALPQISDIELQNINATTVKLKVTIPGEKNALVGILKSQHQLQPNTLPSDSAADANSLSYSWQPKKSNPNL